MYLGQVRAGGGVDGDSGGGGKGGDGAIVVVVLRRSSSRCDESRVPGPSDCLHLDFDDIAYKEMIMNSSPRCVLAAISLRTPHAMRPRHDDEQEEEG